MRRVIDCSGLPFKRGWRVIGKALRGILVRTGVSREVTDMRVLGRSFRQECSRIQHTQGLSSCRICSAPLPHDMSVVTADVDQAFEACASSLVLDAVSRIFTVFRIMFRTGYINVVVSLVVERFTLARRGLEALAMQYPCAPYSVLSSTIQCLR